MTDRPAPLVPSDVDLRDYGFYPIDINRLFGSEFHAVTDDAAWRAGLTLWLKSYHQVPAGSIPDDDVALTRLAELGRDIKSWKKIREMSLRGWVACTDGRLYHPVVAEKALEGWIGKLGQRKASAAGVSKRKNIAFDGSSFDKAMADAAQSLRSINPHSSVLIRLHRQAETGPAIGATDGTTDGPAIGATDDATRGCTGARPSKERVIVKGDIDSSLRSQRAQERVAIAKRIADEFECEFWAIWPHKVGKPDAAKAFLKKRLAGVPLETIVDGAQRYIAEKPDWQQFKSPAAWLNGDRFSDAPAAPANSRAGPRQPETGLLTRLAFGQRHEPDHLPPDEPPDFHVIGYDPPRH